MLNIPLPTLEHTARLGRRLALLLKQHPRIRAVLLHGPLGSGKTTLTRSLVEALPGGQQAEISSPSFTLCNLYPTTPPVLHCDLYRAGSNLPDELWEALDDHAPAADAGIAIIEWAEYIPGAALPDDYLDIRLDTCEEERLATVEPHGVSACGAVMDLQHEDWIAQ